MPDLTQLPNIAEAQRSPLVEQLLVLVVAKVFAFFV